MSLGKIILWWKGLNFLGSYLFGLLLWLKAVLETLLVASG